jgi:hypothetical protein
MQEGKFKPNFMPGICVYKGLYTGLDLFLPNGSRDSDLGWMYVIPNPLLPMIWYRVALPGIDKRLIVERFK